jgi:hypothetical protein
MCRMKRLALGHAHQAQLTRLPRNVGGMAAYEILVLTCSKI